MAKRIISFFSGFCLFCLFACRPSPGPPEECPEILPDTLSVIVASNQLPDTIGEIEFITDKNGDRQEHIFLVAVPTDTLVDTSFVNLYDPRYTIDFGITEAEDMKLIGYEIDPYVGASGKFRVELDSDGYEGTFGEIEGAYIGRPALVEIGAAVYGEPNRETIYSILVNYIVVDSLKLRPDKAGFSQISHEMFLDTHSIVSIQAKAEIASKAYIDYVYITQRERKP